MKILVTGASGFVGTYLVRHLLRSESGAEVVGTVHGPGLLGADPAVRAVPCDITANGGADIRALIRRERPDHVYHLAGAASGAGQDRDAIADANVAGTRAVMDAVAEEAPLARTLFVSTGYVYGETVRPAREDDPLRPLGAYAESKRDAEPYARAAGAVIARAFNHTGPGQTTAFAVPAFAAQIAAIERGAQPPELKVGNLEALRDFLDVRDVVRAYHLLMTRAEPGLYNVCRGEAVTMRSVLDGLLALATVPIRVTPDPARMRPSDIPVSVGDPAKLRAATGWQPEVPFAQTLRDTLDWWRAQPEV